MRIQRDELFFFFNKMDKNKCEGHCITSLAKGNQEEKGGHKILDVSEKRCCHQQRLIQKGDIWQDQMQEYVF